jgi:hypothetical protein
MKTTHIIFNLRDTEVVIKKQEMLVLLWHLGPPPVFGGVHVAHLFRFLCCEFVQLYFGSKLTIISSDGLVCYLIFI